MPSCATHRQEPTYEPERHWRGSNWPHLNYLLYRAALAAYTAGRIDRSLPAALARALVSGATDSGLSEYWHPDFGQGFGARPQTWAGLAICV